MAKGRKSKPLAQKKTTGTVRKDRLPESMPSPSSEGMALSLPGGSSVAECFNFLLSIVDGMGNNSASYGPALSLAALRMDEVINLTNDIIAEGETYKSEGRNGMQVKANPKVGMRSEAMRHFHSLLAEFGLTPASIQKIGSLPRGGGNPFEEFV